MKYHDENWLCEQYWDQRKSCQEIADECGVHNKTIWNWMDKHDIPRRSHREAELNAHRHPRIASRRGYLEAEGGGDGAVGIHRLAAVAWYGYDVVVDNVVHHENGCRFDNREENLRVVSRSVHMAEHHERGDIYG